MSGKLGCKQFNNYAYNSYVMKTHFTEYDIRPSEYQQGLSQARDEDIAYLTGKKGSFVLVACPGCASKASRFAFKKYGFDFVSCRECDSVYMNPRAPQSVLSEFYASSKMYDYWNTHIFPSSEATRRENIIKPRVARIISIS